MPPIRMEQITRIVGGVIEYRGGDVMLTEIGRADYPLPDGFHGFLHVFLAMGEVYMELRPIRPAEMNKLMTINNEPVCGVPTYYSIADSMTFYPVPSGEWEIARTWTGARPCQR